MKTFIRVFVAVLVLAATLAASSYLLPGSYRVERSIVVNAPAEAIFAMVGDLKAWASWTVWAEQDPEIEWEYSDATTGVGSWQRWNGPKSGRGELTVTASQPPLRLEYDLHFPDYEAHSKGVLALEPTEGGVRVTWSDAGNLGMNPAMRWFGLLFDRLIGGDFTAGLERLKAACESKPAE